MATTADCASGDTDAAYWEPLHRYHDFYARLFLRGAIATLVVAVLSLLFVPWSVSAVLFVGAAIKALLWAKNQHARREIEARIPALRTSL